MLRERARLLQNLSVLMDALVVSLAFVLSYFVKGMLPGDLGRVFEVGHILWLPLVGVPLWLIALYMMGMYRSQRTTEALESVVRIGGAAVLVGLTLSTVVLGFKIGVGVSRLQMGFWAVFSVSGLTLEKLAVRGLLRRARRHGQNLRFILMVGRPSETRELHQLLLRHAEWGYRILGRLSWSDDEEADDEQPLEGVRLLGDTSRFSEVLEQNSVDEVYIPLLPERWNQIERIVGLCEEVGVNVRIKPNTFGAVLAKSYVDYLAEQPILTYTTTPTHPGALFLKQLFDYVAAAVLVVLLSPLLLATAIAVKLSSAGPVLFRQERCGLNGRRFVLYKFRSMVANAERLQRRLQSRNEVSGPVFKIRNDPRVTAVGRWIRKLSIDELPQLFNVLKGEMSLVGPRPPLPSEVEQYERWQRRRLSMKPGITCLWQIKGRTHVDFEDWMRLDLQYIDNWSLLLDFRILLRTVGVVLLRRGAY